MKKGNRTYGAVTAGVLAYLEAHRGRLVTVRELVDHLYGDLEDGGPDDAEGVVRFIVFSLRRREQNRKAIRTVSGYILD